MACMHNYGKCLGVGVLQVLLQSFTNSSGSSHFYENECHVAFMKVSVMWIDM
jgi:hypothetical protein